MTRSTVPALFRTLAICSFMAWGATARAEFIINVTFDDPTNAFGGLEDAIRTDVVAAGKQWGSYFAGTTTLNVEVQAGGIATAGGASTTTLGIGRSGDFEVEAQGAAAKVLGLPGSGGPGPDAIINLSPSYAANELYYDPNPGAGPVALPGNKTDAYSVFLHEFGHILAFNGDRNPATGQYRDHIESTFDRYTAFDGSKYTFTGPMAEATYGGPVPLYSPDYTHVGNLPPGDGQQLDKDLMFGAYFYRGRRYQISTLDLAIVADTGMVAEGLAVPEPKSCALLGMGGVLLTIVRRRRGRASGGAR